MLPSLQGLVHHGGIGTNEQALAADIPQRVVPFAHDQFDNAARLCQLEVAIALNPAAPAACCIADPLESLGRQTR